MVKTQGLVTECEDSIARILMLFKPDRDVRVTVAIREVNNPEAEFILTSDELVCVIEMLERRRAAGAST